MLSVFFFGGVWFWFLSPRAEALFFFFFDLLSFGSPPPLVRKGHALGCSGLGTVATPLSAIRHVRWKGPPKRSLFAFIFLSPLYQILGKSPACVPPFFISWRSFGEGGGGPFSSPLSSRIPAGYILIPGFFLSVFPRLGCCTFPPPMWVTPEGNSCPPSRRYCYQCGHVVFQIPFPLGSCRVKPGFFPRFFTSPVPHGCQVVPGIRLFSLFLVSVVWHCRRWSFVADSEPVVRR